MPFKLLHLPYKKNSLEPYISSETINFHYEKHHKTYVENLNKLIHNTSYNNQSLEKIIISSKNAIFNNAAQVWNHNFYWNCLTEPHISKKSYINNNKFIQKISDNFESFNKFKEEFSMQALGNFGSGWTWLVKTKNNQLEIFNTKNADTPIMHNKIPLMTIDIWEHAYYIDYRNVRLQYIKSFWQIINWNFISNNYANH